MKLNRPAILVSISLLVLGGLYFAFSRPGSQVTAPKPVGHKRQTSQALIPSESTSNIAPLAPEERPPEVVESEAANAGVQKSPPKLIGKTSASSSAPPATPEVRAIAADRQTGRPTPAPTDPEDKPAQPGRGIRLAPDVRLPVAAMPNDLNLNPIRQQALQNIIDEYYQTLAAAVPARGVDNDTSVADGSAGAYPQPNFTSVTEENGEETVIIHNSPTVEAARARADQLFKALFGKAAYNRMTMNTLLESRLPQSPTEP
jgi:hypothetical protein